MRVVYERLTIPWASSLLAFAALGMSFIPILFIKYGTGSPATRVHDADGRN